MRLNNFRRLFMLIVCAISLNAHAAIIPAAPEQVIVTAGALQAVDLVCRVFVRPGDVVVVHPDTDFRYALFRTAVDRWACSKDRGDAVHQHDDAQVDGWFDNGLATAIIAGGKVVTE